MVVHGGTGDVMIHTSNFHCGSQNEQKGCHMFLIEKLRRFPLMCISVADVIPLD